jgi:hypothetical protein
MTEQSEQKVSEKTVKINGIEHTMLLSDEDAKRYEAAEETFQAQKSDAGAKSEKAPANKAKSAQDK